MRYWVIIAVLVFLLWPIKWGGQFGGIMVSGHSMESTYYTGDLLIIKKASAEVGKVMVYEVPDHETLHVVHRVVSGNATDGWIFRGDNNTWDDPFTVPDANMVGTPILRIQHVGIVVDKLSNPIVIVSLIIFALGILLWPRSQKKVRKSATSPVETPADAPETPDGDTINDEPSEITSSDIPPEEPPEPHSN